jgi:hypothetical protein
MGSGIGGFLGIGGSSAKTDRGNQLAATQGEWNIFGYGLPQGESAQAQSTATLGQAGNAFQSLLSATVPGRTQIQQNAAPAINAAQSQADATRRAEATSGTGRTGGTAELNREAGATTNANIDSIISQQLGIQQNLQTQKQIAGAEGLAKVGGLQEASAANLLGLGSSADTNILQNATESRGQSQAINTQTAQGYGTAAGTLLTLALGF